MVKKFFSLLLLLNFFCGLFFPTSSFAYPSAVSVLPAKDIVKLSDSALTSVYLDTIIEIEAIKIFHKTSGFSPKEYQEYKSLLRFRYELKSELQHRQLDIPSIDEERN